MKVSSSHNDASFYENINEDYIDHLVNVELEAMQLDLNGNDNDDDDDDKGKTESSIFLTDDQDEIDDYQSQQIVRFPRKIQMNTQQQQKYI
jgi:hypothetical protein